MQVRWLVDEECEGRGAASAAASAAAGRVGARSWHDWRDGCSGDRPLVWWAAGTGSMWRIPRVHERNKKTNPLHYS